MCLAIPGKLISIKEQKGYVRVGRVDFSGIFKKVNPELVPSAKPDAM